MLLAVHFLACGWIYLQRIELSLYHYERTWIQNNDLVDKSWFFQYTYSFYFMLVTVVTVGYGNSLTPCSSTRDACRILSHSLFPAAETAASVIEILYTESGSLRNSPASRIQEPRLIHTSCGRRESLAFPSLP